MQPHRNSSITQLFSLPTTSGLTNMLIGNARCIATICLLAHPSPRSVVTRSAAEGEAATEWDVETEAGSVMEWDVAATTEAMPMEVGLELLVMPTHNRIASTHAAEIQRHRRTDGHACAHISRLTRTHAHSGRRRTNGSDEHRPMCWARRDMRWSGNGSAVLVTRDERANSTWTG